MPVMRALGIRLSQGSHGITFRRFEDRTSSALRDYGSGLYRLWQGSDDRQPRQPREQSRQAALVSESPDRADHGGRAGAPGPGLHPVHPQQPGPQGGLSTSALSGSSAMQKKEIGKQ